MASTQDIQVNALEQKDIQRLFWNYAIPAIVATTAVALYNIIDRIFIGHGIGPLAISGLALTFPLMTLSTALGTLVGAGASALVSIRLGQKEPGIARLTLGNALMLNILCGLFTAILFLSLQNPILRLFGASNDTLPYAREFLTVILGGNVITQVFFGMNNVLRASGHPKKAMASTLLTVCINLMLAPLFIFAFHWGIRGAAFATILSQSTGTIWTLSHLLNRKHTVHFDKGCFKPDWHIIKNIFTIGLSPFILHCCTCIIVIIINLQLKKYGDIDFGTAIVNGKVVQGGDLAIGAFGIINTIAGFMVMIFLGMAQGMQPIAGYNYGAKRLDRVNKVLKITIRYASLAAVVCFLTCQCFPRQIAGMFVSNPDIIDITAHGLQLYMFMFIFSGFQVVTSYIFQAINKPSVSILLSLLRQAVCLIPCLLLFPLWWHTEGVWLSQAAADFIAALITAGILWYHKSQGALKE